MSPSNRRLAIAAALGLGAALAVIGWLWKSDRNRAAERPPETAARAQVEPVRQRSSSPPTGSPVAPEATGRPHRLVAAQAVVDAEARAGAFAGRVVNWATGRGVADAEIVMSGGDEAAQTVRTGADGAFTFVPSEPATYRSPWSPPTVSAMRRGGAIARSSCERPASVRGSKCLPDRRFFHRQGRRGGRRAGRGRQDPCHHSPASARRTIADRFVSDASEAEFSSSPPTGRCSRPSPIQGGAP
jgi:hypothetical protein